MKTKKEIREMLTIAQRQGCVVEMTNKGHYRVTATDGQFTIISPTRSAGYRGFRNQRACLRRIGVRI